MRVLMAALCLAVTLSVVAQEGPRVAFTDEATPSAVDLMAQLNGRRGGDGSPSLRPVPNVVLEGAEPAFIFPVVGSAGAFRTEGVIVNRRTTSQRVAAFYWPIGGGSANCNRSARVATLNAQTNYLYTDLVADIFSEAGFGSVIIIGIDSAGNADSNARLDGNARIWSVAAGGGTASQNFPSMSVQVPAGAQSAFGLRSDEFYRTNWGIFNYDSLQRTFDLVFNGPRGQAQASVNIPPCSLIQQPVTGGPYGSLEILFSPRDGRGLFYAYGSSVDNVSSDAWSVPARH